jgi:hypothetical protein
MQKKQSLLLAFMACCLITLSISACKKDSETADNDTQPAQDNSMAESNYNDANTMVDASVTLGSSFSFRMATNQAGARIEDVLGGCTQVSVDTTSSPRKVTIDFGTTNCECADGRKRRGKIIATWTGRYRDQGTVIIITFDNYFVNDNQVKGTHKTTNLGLNNNARPVFKIEVDGSIVKANNGGTITWTSTRQREWLQGFHTPLNILDDIYAITGTASGTLASGQAYTIAITQPLLRNMSCYWFESGKVEVTPEGRLTRMLDYGSSGCDNKATVTIYHTSGNTTFNVTLP